MITQDLELAATDSPRYWKTISLARGTRQEICLTITDLMGRVTDLGSKEPVQADKCATGCQTADGEETNPGFADGIEPKRDWPDLSFRLRAVPAPGQPALFDVTGRLMNAAAGKVVFHLTERQSRSVGIFLAEVGLFRQSLLLARWPLYLMIEPSVFDRSYTGDGMITIPEVRLALADEMPEDNFVLDAVEFRDGQILACIRKPIDLWNSLLPLDRRYAFNLQNFPYRYPWLQATTGFLLETAAHGLRRNDIQLAGGGISVRDKARHVEYEQKAQQLLREYREWAQNAKASMSVMDAFGTIQSSYYRRPMGTDW